MDEKPQKRRLPWYVRFVVGANPMVTLVRAAIWAVVLLVLFKFVFIGIRVRGESMEPNYHAGQIKLLNRLAYTRHPPQRGDVVAFRLPDPSTKVEAVILKRVIALPGETLSLRRGQVFINGKPLDEPYAKGLTSFRSNELTLEPHQYWLIGDNRPISEQYFKFDYEILGKVLL